MYLVNMKCMVFFRAQAQLLAMENMAVPGGEEVWAEAKILWR